MKEENFDELLVSGNDFLPMMNNLSRNFSTFNKSKTIPESVQMK